jgi:hypothetical protein
LTLCNYDMIIQKNKQKQAVENTTSENVRLANKMDGREECSILTECWREQK